MGAARGRGLLLPLLHVALRARVPWRAPHFAAARHVHRLRPGGDVRPPAPRDGTWLTHPSSIHHAPGGAGVLSRSLSLSLSVISIYLSIYLQRHTPIPDPPPRRHVPLLRRCSSRSSRTRPSSRRGAQPGQMLSARSSHPRAHGLLVRTVTGHAEHSALQAVSEPTTQCLLHPSRRPLLQAPAEAHRPHL